ncbi:MAG: WXG100 family type VII secretion target [Suilimivivens sp.]
MAGNKIEVDPEILRSTAKKVETSSADLSKELKRFQTVIEGLESTWSSDVKERFLQNYQKDLAALTEMVNQYAEVSEGLLWIADELEQAEEEIGARIQAVAKG